MEPKPRSGPEQRPTPIADRTLGTLNKIDALRTNPDIRQGIQAAVRTFANAGILLTDIIPGIGMSAVVADAAKTVRQVGKRIGIDLEKLDLTPDVPWWQAIPGSAVEPVTGGVIPSHLPEALMQARADVPRIKKGLQTALAIWKDEYADFEAHAIEITDAANQFGVDINPPQK